MRHVASLGRAFGILSSGALLGGAFALGRLRASLPMLDRRMSVRGSLARAAIEWLPTVGALLNP